MKAWAVTQIGEPSDVLKIIEAEEPALKSGDVGIETHAVGLNFLDVMACRGSYPWNPEPPFIPCAELVGEVYAVNDADHLKVGQRVVGMIPAAYGALAERCVAPAQYVFALEPDISDEQAAALLVTHQTAWFALKRAQLQAGEVVLIQGGAGGVGSAAIQLSKIEGATVIATASTEAKLEVCRQQGADHVVSHRSPDFVDQVMSFTLGRGVDVVLDQIGGSATSQLLASLALEGRLVLIGWASGEAPSIDAQQLVMKNISVIGLSWGSTYPTQQPKRVHQAHRFVQEQVLNGRLNPLIYKTASFDHASEMLQALATGQTVGKVVVRIR